MNGTGIYQVIVGITLMITGLVLGYDGLWGALMILLGCSCCSGWLKWEECCKATQRLALCPSPPEIPSTAFDAPTSRACLKIL